MRRFSSVLVAAACALGAAALPTPTAAGAHASGHRTPSVRRGQDHVTLVPIWAAISLDRPLLHATVSVHSLNGKPLAPPAKVGRSGAATVGVGGWLPPAFTIVVTGVSPLTHRADALRAAVRNWTGERVVYVDPYTTVLAAYLDRHRRMSFDDASQRVTRHLGLGTLGDADRSTFWAQRSFSGARFAAVAARHGGILTYARRIAAETDHEPRHAHLFRVTPRGSMRAKVAGYEEEPDLGAQRKRTEEELTDGAKAALGVATGSPTALVEFGRLLDSLLGGGGTKVLEKISAQLQTIQTGVSQLEQQVSALNTEVALDAYATVADEYAPYKLQIEPAWERYVHAAAVAAEGNAVSAKAEASHLEKELATWGNVIYSSYYVPNEEGKPGLLTLAENAIAKNTRDGIMTTSTQAQAQAAASKYWVLWAEDTILHVEKWSDPKITTEIESPEAQQARRAVKGLEEATATGYGKPLPRTLVYAVNTGELYSVGTTWNIEPSVAPVHNGDEGWVLTAPAQAEALPAHDQELGRALMESVPPPEVSCSSCESVNANPNANMAGIFNHNRNNGHAPTFSGTGGGYGYPPTGVYPENPKGTYPHYFSLNSCYGQWNWLTNGQGSNNTDGAPIIELCPALDAETMQIVHSVCTQVNEVGNFFGWSNKFGLDVSVEFVTCNDVEHWQNESKREPSLTWGTGVFAGDSPLSSALGMSDVSQQSYYGLWSRPVNKEDEFLVGPVTLG